MSWPVGELADLAALSDDELAARYAPVEPGAPLTRVNVVSSLDGAVEIGGTSAGLSGPADRRLLRLLRALSDAVLAGAGTLRREGYRPVRLDGHRRAWRRAHGLTDCPPLVIVSARLDLTPDHPAIAQAPVPPIVLTCETAPAGPRAALATVAEVLTTGDRTVDLRAGLDRLHARGLRHVLCEGGPQLFGALAAEDLVDEVCLTLSPRLAGPGAGRIATGPYAAARWLALRDALTAEGMLFLRYLRLRRAARPDAR